MSSFDAKSLSGSYDPQAFEERIYAFWERTNCFHAQDRNAPHQKAFSIPIPPPNVTGALHMGHALTCTLQDILIRWRRMHQDNTLWLPGTDHAGIATQVQVEKIIAKEGKNAAGRPLSRHDLGRQKFLERTWQWKAEQGGTITQQLKKLGASLDWNRERFTLDEGLSKAVREVFVQLYEEGLIYRGERIINWCTRCQTALSDLEVLPQEKQGNFWHIRYQVADSDLFLIIATTRPETLLGDAAVAVHPEDERYQALHGQELILPLIGRRIPLLTDSYVDREFGSGALKITPAHDFNDAELGKKHGLPNFSVMGKEGRLTPEAGPYAGLTFSEARKRILADLEATGALVKVENHVHHVGVCSRCETVAEPILSKQWFVKMEPLAAPAIEAVQSGKIQFYPKAWDKTYFEWMHNIRDWCISRQLWWGHPIPVWYCQKCSGMTVHHTNPEKCKHCLAPAEDLRQDEDVLDTWFSSALWPFSTLGWPDKTEALKTFYPNSILETGFDILFFWVARMIMMGIHFMGEVPFHRVYLHAMVRDEKGDKMSKSKGNVIDPLIVMKQQGTDALRFTLATMAGQGRDIKLSVDRVSGYRAFCNKLWNAVKFFHLQWNTRPIEIQLHSFTEVQEWLQAHASELALPHQWILSRLQTTVQNVETGLQNFELNHASQCLYDFIWHEFCDWYIEAVKWTFKEYPKSKKEGLFTLCWVIEEILKLLHPFMPFVTEELWQSLPHVVHWTPDPKTIMLQTFPKPIVAFINQKAENEWDKVKKVVESIRQFKGENGIPAQTQLSIESTAQTPQAAQWLNDPGFWIGHLAKAHLLTPTATTPNGQGMISHPDLGLEFHIRLENTLQGGEETKRLSKLLEKVKKDLEFVNGKLSQELFLAHAPAAIIEKEKRRQQELSVQHRDLEAALARLQSS